MGGKQLGLGVKNCIPFNCFGLWLQILLTEHDVIMMMTVIGESPLVMMMMMMMMVMMMAMVFVKLKTNFTSPSELVCVGAGTRTKGPNYPLRPCRQIRLQLS